MDACKIGPPASPLGSMQDWVSWCSVTSVQLVTTPPMRLPCTASSRMMRSSTAVALNSFTLGALSTCWGDKRLFCEGGGLK